ncbi:MAG: serine protease [Pseudomonadota bacterium]
MKRSVQLGAVLLAVLFLSSCQLAAFIIKLPKPVGDLSKAEVIEKYFKNRDDIDPVEGVWAWPENDYEIAILKNTSGLYPDYDYVGVVTSSKMLGWQRGETKILLKKTATSDIYTLRYFQFNKISHDSMFNLPFYDRNIAIVWVPWRDNLGKRIGDQRLTIVRTYRPGDAQGGGGGGGGTGTGTGFFITQDVIVTNHHVVAKAKKISISWNGQELPATVLTKDESNDLALLRVSFPTKDQNGNPAPPQVRPLPFGEVGLVKEGQKAYAIGFPVADEMGMSAKISEGIINSLCGMHDDPRLWQMSVPIQPGNSGSPLFNAKGQVIGIVTSTFNNEYLVLRTGVVPQNVNYAVKINYLKNLLTLAHVDGASPQPLSTKDLDAAQLMDLARGSVVLVKSNF